MRPSSNYYHVFSLPPELLQSFIPRTHVNQLIPSSAPSLDLPTQSKVQGQPMANTSGPISCTVCLGITFLDVHAQRAHYRSDWHRYNVKTRLNGGKAVTESAFAQLVEALEDSLSGSASSSTEEEDENYDTDKVTTLIHKTQKLLYSSHQTNDDDSNRHGIVQPQTALTWFHSPPATQIGVYRALFPRDTETNRYLDELRAMQRHRGHTDHGQAGEEGIEGKKWAMFMVAGGHFAGAIVRVSRPVEEKENTEKENSKKKPKPKQQAKPETEVLKSKTFHRYTTRRKQGGSQSVNDNAKGAAISAGAMLRRYGEQALRDDIRNLLRDWADEIDSCELIWIRANVSNRRIFLDYEEAVIQKGDERLRTFPFTTRRPTQSELTRCLLELTRVKVTHLSEDELRAQDEAYLASLPQRKPPPPARPIADPDKNKPLKAPKLTREDEVLRDKWTKLLDMVNRGRLEPLRTFWEREGAAFGSVDALIPEWTGDRRGTILQVGAQAGHEDVTRWLLEELRADPTIPVPNTRIGLGMEVDEDEAKEDGNALDTQSLKGYQRTAYDLAKTRAVRDVFRRCAATYPEWWDWFGAARVPSGLSKEMEEEREEKKKVRRKGL
ncbi:hypothetical protein AMATHDRAFT_59968, partial [Amanita thiersii Skay4041]